MKNYQQMTKAELIRCLKAQKESAPKAKVDLEHEGLLHELQVHQIELETQNRDLREAQLLLESSRDRYADLYDFAPVGYLTLDHRGIIREINLTAAGMLGVERTRLVGMPFHLHVARADLARLREHLHQISDKRVTTELHLAARDGRSLVVAMQSALEYDAHSKTYLCRASLTDLTLRCQAEEALRQSSALTHGILSSLSAHIAVLDKLGNIIAVNEAWSDFARANGDSTLAQTGVGVNYLDACLHATGVSRAEARRAAEGIRAVLKRALPVYAMEYSCDSQREKRWFQMSVTPLIARDHGVVISHLDISRRRLAEEALSEKEARLRAVLETAVDAIITIDERGTIESFNLAAEKLFGYPAMEAIGQNISFLMPAPHREQHDRYLANYRATGERKVIGVGREVSGRRKDGSTFPLLLAVSEVQLAGRRIFTGIVRDISEQRRLELEMLSIADREQQRIGHDLHDGLGQQLTALDMKCFLLQEDLESGDLLAKREKLLERTRELGRLLRESVTATRMISRGLAPHVLRLDGLTGALLELARSTCVPGQIECRLDCPAPVKVSNSVQAKQLYRIAQEAVNNAVKHSGTRHICIHLRHQQGILRLTIEDDGRGLIEGEKSKSGIGLGIMRHRATVIGASLEINSRPGEGVKITCTLALPKDHED